MVRFEYFHADHAEVGLARTHSGLANHELAALRSFDYYSALRTSAEGYVVWVVQPIIGRLFIACLSWVGRQQAIRAAALPTGLTHHRQGFSYRY